MADTGLVYRDAIDTWTGASFAAHVERCARAAATEAGRAAALTSALVLAGAVEAAVEDAGLAVAAPAARALTDELAAALVEGRAPRPGALGGPLDGLRAQGPLRLRRPEGFAYYGLAPLAFARAAVAMAASDGPVGVVGLRSIGSTLSAVARAGLAAAGRPADRVTVRPTGHPFDRRWCPDAVTTDWVRRCASAGGSFLVVDEGPGLSGSSFLAVAEGLVALGVPADRVALLGSRPVTSDALCAPDAAARWARLRYGVATETPGSPPAPARDLSGGAWRRLFWADEGRWPAVWASRERRKHLVPAAAGPALVKYEGLGPWGEACHARAVRLAEGGFGPPPLAPPDERGDARYEWCPGQPLDPGACDGKDLARVASYCAFRRHTFEVSGEDASSETLELMARHDVALLTGRSLPASFRIIVDRAVVADGRMAPHEWFRSPDMMIRKADGVAHGDDHFFPGPTDVAWDLAGTIVEWGLSDDAAELLVSAYEATTRDRVGARLAAYVIAYAALRACLVRLAAQDGPVQERRRHWARYRGYRRRLGRALAEISA
jgi:hypothetical protein